MGRQKDWYMEMTSDGMDLRRASTMTVCGDCAQDEDLTAWVTRNADATVCSYCDRTGRMPFAAPMIDLVQFVNTCLHKEYEDADGALGLDDEAENGFYGDTEDTYDVLDRELAFSDTDTPFVHDLRAALGDRLWCRADPYGPAEHELLAWSWRGFRETVLHERRFFFREAADRKRRSDDETPSVEALLDGLMRYCRRSGLFQTIPAGARFYRCQRIRKGDSTPFDAGRMGPPPPALALQSNRMSPAGIPMFYGSEDRLTALLETFDRRRRAAIGRFETLRPIHVLDLSRVTPTPSLFEDGTREDRAWSRFLREFLEDFTRPISRNGGEHVDYAPTQIVAEYIRVFARHRKSPLDGVVYRSARLRGKTSVVLFAGTSDVEGPHRDSSARGQPWLRMAGYRERVFDPAPHLALKLPVFSDALARSLA